MPISDAAIESLFLGKEVFNDLSYCLQQWQEAGWKAASDRHPADDNSQLDWAISFIGNLAWAITVFFPPAFETSTALKITYATASRATKAVSMIGATLGAGIVPELRKLYGELDSPQGTEFLKRYFGSQVPDILHEYNSQAKDWIENDLLNHLIAQYSLRFRPNPKDNNDAAFIAFVNGNEGAEERRRYVWNAYVFPGDVTTYDNRPDERGGRIPGGQQGLQDFFSQKLDEMIRDFNFQWRSYYEPICTNAWTRVEGTRGHVNFYEEIERLMKARPFNPIFRFKGMPPKLQDQQEDNRRRLKLLMDKYGINT